MIVSTRRVCRRCAKPIHDGDLVHTTSGTHAACWYLGRATARGAEAVPVPGRLNGGYKIHAVDLRTGRAVCGAKPSNTSSMRRGKWLILEDANAAISCKQCLRAIGLVDAVDPSD